MQHLFMRLKNAKYRSVVGLEGGKGESVPGTRRVVAKHCLPPLIAPSPTGQMDPAATTGPTQL